MHLWHALGTVETRGNMKLIWKTLEVAALCLATVGPLSAQTQSHFLALCR